MNLATHPDRKKSPRAWGDLVRGAYPQWDGPWPRVMIMHGTADTTVQPDAADELVEQWTNVHGLALEPDQTDEIAGHQRARFLANGQVAVERWRIEGMGHAFPIGRGDPEHGCGQVAAYFEDRDLCGAWRALEFFGLAGDDGTGSGGSADAGPSGDDGDGSGSSQNGDGGGGCSVVGDSGSWSYVLALALLAAAISVARRRRAARSTLPAPVRGSSGTNS
jgi:MYXO-CTERM domain-containing protein